MTTKVGACVALDVQYAVYLFHVDSGMNVLVSLLPGAAGPPSAALLEGDKLG